MKKRETHAAIISLGCSKNLVDAECMARILTDNEIQMVSDPGAAEVIIVNTCGFIESAKKEAIDTILEMTEYKSHGVCDFLIVTGCLAQRYGREMELELPEVDAILGTGSYQDIGDTVLRLYGISDGAHRDPAPLGHIRADRIVTTRGYAWMKIAEGCLHRCAFCAIPFIRGKYRSRPVEELLEEARTLSENGFSEIILIAQDTTSYGVDLYGRRMLPELLRALSAIENVRLFRIMYMYMDGITDELIGEIAANPKIAKYVDIPIQHGDDGILRAMRRSDTSARIRQTISRIRAAIPDIILRTTVLVGFPGETEDAFRNLLDLLEDMRFDRLGAFVFSAEEGTAAFSMESQVPNDLAQRRLDELMLFQQSISLQKNEERVGRIFDVSIESTSEDGVFYRGRSYGEAPEVDPTVYVVAPLAPLEMGQVVPVRIIDCSEYDLVGEALS